jgi:hypothetical protein
MTPFLAVLLLSAAPAPGPTSPKPAVQATSSLPLRAVVLYENGVGYFERKGAVAAGSVAQIPLEPGQLDDALKSLVVMSTRGVASVEFAPSIAPEAARASAGMPENQSSMLSLLRSLAGVDVKVTAGAGSVSGRIVEVDEVQELDKDGKPVAAPVLMLFGEAGLVRVPLKQITAVKPVDPSVQLAWERATGSHAAQPERQSMRVRGGQGGGDVAVGYTTEAPVWRTTYRLVVGKAGQRLQGFALVHNDSDEAWEGVKVTLASGRPNSFVFPLAGPRYGRRELVNPEDGLDAAPQLTSSEVRDHLRGAIASGGSVSMGSIGTVGYGSGAGMGSSRHSVAAGVAGASVAKESTAPSDLLQEGPTPLEPAAVSEAGELFLYTVKEPVFLAARKSALLPIVDTKTQAEPVTVVGQDGKSTLAVRFLNDTGLTLEAGTLSIFEQGTYSGESQLDRVKPGEVRIVKHGTDLDVEVSQSEFVEAGPVKRVRRANGLIELHRVDRVTHALKLVSRSEHPRTLLFELPREGYRVTSGGDEDVRSPGQARYARVQLAARESKEVPLLEEGRVVQRLRPESVTVHMLDGLLAEKVEPDVRATLLALRGEATRAEDAQQRRSDAERRIREMELDVTRLRENLAAVGKGGAKDAAAELASRLLKLEDELTRLRGEAKESEKTAAKAYQALLATR